MLARAGDDQAFSELVNRRQASIRGLLRRWSADAALADDLAQEAFVLAWKRLRQLEAPGAFGGWLRQIALNVWLRHARKARLLLDDVADQAELPDRRTTDTAVAMDLERALTQLTPAQRLCVVLSYSEGMSHPEIAAATGMAPGTVKSHIRRGAEKLRQLLGSAPDDN